MNRLSQLTMIVLLLAAAPCAWSAAPVVQNVTFAQRTDGSGLADISYDVSDAEGDALAVGVAASHDGGQTWHVPVRTLSGDVGQGVAPGVDRRIVWNVAADLGPDVPGALSVRVTASDLGVVHTTHSPANYWVMDWWGTDWSDKALLERIAKSDVAVIAMYALWNSATAEQDSVLARIRELNPDIVLLGYYLAKTNILHWEDDPIGSFTRTLFDRTAPYWTQTTAGDTLMNWPEQVVLDVMEPACRDAIASTLAEYQAASVNKVDGVMWDYFDETIWISPGIAPQVEGDPDLDRDGVPMASDADERLAYWAACDSLVLNVRDRLGDDFIQVFNGVRAHRQPEFAALGDGMYYEIFPTQVFPDPDMRHALDPDYELSLFNAVEWPRTVNGGPYIVLGMQWRSFYIDYQQTQAELSFGDMYRAIGLLTDTYATWIPGAHKYHWPDVEINLGEPLGPTVIAGDEYSRDFEWGRIEMSWKTEQYPNPVRYRITIRGNVVQELDTPYHYP